MFCGAVTILLSLTDVYCLPMSDSDLNCWKVVRYWPLTVETLFPNAAPIQTFDVESLARSPHDLVLLDSVLILVDILLGPFHEHW
jgi:hypothetical protein